MHGERMSEVMDTWLIWVDVGPRDACDPAQTLEALLYDWPLDRLVYSGLEQWLLLLISSFRHSYILTKQLMNIAPKRNKA